MKSVIKRDLTRLMLVALGSAVMAVSIKSFAQTAGLYPGGLSGLTLLIQAVFEKFAGITLPYTPINLLLNSVPAAICFKYIGRRFTVFSCVAIFLTGLLTDIVPAYPLTEDPLLLGVFGGLLFGVSTCLCLFADATSGGTDFIAIFMSEKHDRDVWNYILVGNVVILAAAGFMFGWEKALYSIIFQFAATQVLNASYKRYQKTTLFIITDKPEEIFDVIANDTHHGMTLFRGTGLYHNKERNMLYSVVSADEIKKVVRVVREIDPGAFINGLKTESFYGNFYKKPND